MPDGEKELMNPSHFKAHFFEPKIVGFLCHWCAYEGADAAGRARLDTPVNLHVVRVMCSGRVDPQFIMQAFADGADGVMVMGCPMESCHYRTGNHQALKRIELLKTLLTPFGIAPERLQLVWVGADDANGFVEHVSRVTQALRSLGPIGRKVTP